MNDCYYGRRYCCAQNFCCPTSCIDNNCCSIRQNQSCCDYFPHSSQTNSRRPIAAKKIGVDAFDHREGKRKSATKSRNSVSKAKAKKASKMKANSDISCCEEMMKEMNVFCGNGSNGGKLLPPEKPGCGCDDSNIDCCNPETYASRGSAASMSPSGCNIMPKTTKNKQNLQNQRDKNRMDVIDEEQEEIPGSFDNQKKMQDSCMDFLSIVHDTVLETVQKSVDAILRDYFINSMDKIDCLCSQMMRNECLLSKMYLDIIDRISQQSEKSLRQFRCLCHFMAENRRNEKQSQKQKCSCNSESPDDSSRREYSRPRPEETRQFCGGSKPIDQHYESRARARHSPTPYENQMSRNNVNYDDLPMLVADMRSPRSSYRNMDMKSRSNFGMNSPKLPMPNPCPNKTPRCIPTCTGRDRNDIREHCRQMEPGNSATSINEEVRKITHLSPDTESLTTTVTPSDMPSDINSRYTQTSSRNNNADVIQRQHISRI